MDGKTFISLLEPQTRSKNAERDLKGINGTSHSGHKVEHYIDRLLKNAHLAVKKTLIRNTETSTLDCNTLLLNQGDEIKKYIADEAKDYFISQQVMQQIAEEEAPNNQEEQKQEEPVDELDKIFKKKTDHRKKTEAPIGNQHFSSSDDEEEKVKSVKKSTKKQTKQTTK